ncbi:LLM class flavin-dependent oxidoreductase [Luteimicrobium subarcticum]|uniref:Alkanesulfonate monooxygenase SsuD/methylene tetrahydromethanopterin reductase-like flavin-dependent oxidoreductase (Luciferase family) n=1 Tax=Luteimicrobium subarcticum TaxID=620910 RepID=A0A2M8WSB2_9MICO|nr:LLM class flavin-dependent oxidoreductase [Luteimicrobium subarcticum]PJI93819.1 alkanesulfonate monooxygenase SsuD/methylene tetrahydromethanopterin reductase-like flavin-dependent oxidoreductase (luciferase family) [Luteimicrobium subarcticum]
MPVHRTLHLGVDLTDAGAHPGAWRAGGSRPPRPFDPARLVDLVATAATGLLDFALFEDSFALQPRRGASYQGRLDAALVAARLAPRSHGIALVPAVDVTHTEPFHVAKAIQTIDHVSEGRAAWQVAWSTSPETAAAFGRRTAPDVVEALTEAEDAIEVAGRLWDSWEDDAEIRDVATHRYVDRDKLHYVDFEGVRFAVKGPSITPRSPQGRPPVVVVVDSPLSLDLAARRADVARVRVEDVDEAVQVRRTLRDTATDAGRRPDELRVLVDVVTVVGEDLRSAQERLDLLTELAAIDAEPGAAPVAGPFDGSLTHVGTALDLADLVAAWSAAGAADGFTIRPASLATDLAAVVHGTVPALQARGLFRTAYPGTTFRDTLGLTRPASRYATTTS